MISRILKNTFANYLLKVLQMVLGFVSIPVLVEALGAEGYGLILLAGTVLGYFMFFDLGLATGVTKYVAEYNAKGDRRTLDQVISTSFWLFTAIGIVVGLLVLVLVEVGALRVFSIPEARIAETESVFQFAALLSLLAWPKLALQGVMRGLEAFASLNFVTGIGRLLAVALAIYAALNDMSLLTVFAAMQCDVVLSLLVLPFLIRRRLPGWRPVLRDARRRTLTMMWAFSGWLMLGKIAILLEYQLDTTLIGIVLPLAAITTYTVLMYPFRIIQQLSGLAASAVMPAVSAAYSSGGDDAIEIFRIKGARLHNAFLAISTVVMLLILEPLILLWMGETYVAQIWIAQVAVLFQFFWQSNALLGQVYVGTGRSRRPGIVAIVTGVTNLLLSVALVQVIGLSGVVLGTILAGALGVIFFIYWCLPEIGIYPRDYFMRILIAGQWPIWAGGLLFWSLCSWAGLSVDSWMMLVLVAAAMGAMLVLVAWRFVLDPDDRVALGSLLVRIG